MTGRNCHDCGVSEKRDKTVQIRQCDWLLCDTCEKSRKAGIIRKKQSVNTGTKGQTHNASSTPIHQDKTRQVTLRELLSNPSKLLNDKDANKDMKKTTVTFENTSGPWKVKRTPTRNSPNAKSHKAATPSYYQCAANSSLLMNDLNLSKSSESEEFSRCRLPECPSDNSCKDFAHCTLCKNVFHLNCANLKKMPAKSTKWICVLCKDFPSQLNELKQIITTVKTENDLLRQKVSSLESRVLFLEDKLVVKDSADVDDLNDVTNAEQSTDRPSKTLLLLGESMLRDVKNDHFKGTVVKSMSGAKVCDIVGELNSRDDMASFRNVCIHCGTNDVASGTPTKDIVENIETAITSIMISSPNTSVHISAVCPRDNPRLSLKIDLLNKDLKELTTRLGCSFIDTGLMMTYRNGDVDISQFVDGLHFNERGSDTFIRALADGIPELEQNTDSDWTRVLARHDRVRNKVQRSAKPPFRKGRTDSHGRRNWQPRKDNGRVESQMYKGCSSGSVGKGSQFLRDRRSRFHNRESDDYTGCFNCGLKNHNRNTCRFNHRVRCHACNALGHKERYCRV